MNRSVAESIIDAMERNQDKIHSHVMKEFLKGGVIHKSPLTKRHSIDITQKEYLTHEEAAFLLGISESHLYTLVHKDIIPRSKGSWIDGKRGNHNYFRPSDLYAYMSSHTTTLDEDQSTDTALKMLTAEFVADAASKKRKP